ncbi:thiamine phosphate synthase [Xanthobacter sp. AM11]|uniref:thiamine phosphate synthase n=1 Tax=Xanthobacter sp. AM11 TaxID=3380643 RepID=UPI0039BEE24D
MPAPQPTPTARLMLVLTLSADLRPEAVDAAVRAGDVAAVVLRVPQQGAPAADRLAAVVEAVQRHEAAALVEGPEGLVATAGLDGVHVDLPERLEPTLRALKPRAIVGAGGLESRHDAMVAGESGADYVLFGALSPAAGAFPRTLDFVQWWAELFEVPCVGVASTLEEAEALARAGADFVALDEALVAAGGAGAVAQAQARLAVAGSDR